MVAVALALAACTDGGDPLGFVAGPPDPGQEESRERAAASGAGGSMAGTSVCAAGSAVADAANNTELVADCDVLLSVRDSLRGTGSLNWDANTAIGEWNGVTVLGGRVTGLSLRERGLTGVIPAGLGALGGLTNLDLRDNQLTDPVPASLGNLSRLRSLVLLGNGLTDSIPAELGDLGALRVLDLSRNELAGPIPAELGDLARLTALRLQGNALTGPIPAELGDLSGLELLYLQENELTGAVPAELGGLSRLAELRLGSNGLTGAVPPELGGLGELELLFLDHNALTGAVPAELGDLGSLRTLLLQNNRLTGSIPSELGDLDSLLLLAMADNRLTGSIPPELGGLASLTQLLLQSNRLTGEIPLELGDLENLTHLFLSSNQLTGGIPGSLTRLRSLSDVDLRDNLLGGCVASALHRFKATINPQSGGSVVPDCRPRVDVYPTEGLETVEGGDSDFFWVLLEDSPSADVRIRLSSSDPGEGVMHQKELLFTPRDWYVRRIVGVYGVDDDIRDGPQEYTAVLDTLESTDPRWRGTDPADVRVTNLDNEPEGVPRINAFEAYPHTIPAGGETMLYWLVDRAASIRIEPGVGTVTEDSVPVRPEATTTYTLTAANFDGETMAEATVTVVSDVAVEAFRAVPDSVTRGEEARLEWEVEGAESVFIDGVDVTDSTYLAVAPEATTTYGLAAVNALGDSATAEATVTVVPPPSIASFGADPDTVALGYAARLEWEVEDAHSVFVDGADVTDSTYLAVTPTEATTYELAAVNALGDSATAEVTVTVVPPPAVDTFRAVPDSVTRGEGARLEWAVEGADSVFIDGADVTDSTELAVAPEATTTYTLIAKNRVGGVTQTATAAATLTVVPPASVASFEATPDSVTRGDTARLEWAVEGAESVFIDGADVTDSTYLAVAPETTTTYTLEAVNALGDSATAEVTVTVAPPASIASFGAEPDTIMPGDTARLEWAVEDADSVFIDGADVTDSTYLAVAPEATTTYELAAVNVLGDSVTAEVTVTVAVNSPPVAHVAITGCDAGNYNCTYDASGSTDPDDNIESYGWDMGDGTTLDGAAVEHGFAAPGRYTVTLTVTDSAGATGTKDTVQVVNLPPEADFTASCEALACTFTSTSTDDGGIETWAWDFGDDESGAGAVASHTYAVGGSYDVTLTVTDGLGAEDDTTRTVVVVPSPVIDSFWAVPDTITRGDTARLMWEIEGADSVFLDPGIGNVTDSTSLGVTPDTTTTYTLAATLAGETVTVEAEVTVVPRPEVSITASRTQITLGDDVTLTWRARNTTRGTLLGAPFEGETSGDTTVTPGLGQTTYEITGRNAAGTTVTDEVRVTATRPDPPDFWADPDIITRGDASTLRWTAHSSWTLSIDQGIGSLGAGSGSRPVRPTTTTTYTLTATLAGETVTVEAEVTVVPRPEVSITASRTQITLGDDVTLTWRARNTTRGTLLGAPFEGETSGDTTVTPGLGQTTYEITGRNAAGTTVTDEVRVTATRPDPPDFWADPDIITRGDASTLRWTAHSSWTLSIDQGIGSLGAGSGSRPVRPTTTTTYTLTATLAGETVTVEAEVTVVPRPEVSITASRTQITLGDDVTLTWRARNTTRGTLLGAPFEGETSGDTTVTPGLGQTTYEITGRNAAGTTVTDEVRVTATRPDPPDFWADPDIITRGDASTLRWTAHSSWTLSIDQGIGSLGAGSGSRPVRPTTTTTYTLAATLAGETVTVEAEVTVVPRPEVSITASRTQITLGDDVTLTWRARNTTRGTLLGAPFEGETSGDTTVTPGLGQTTYEITGRNAAGTTVTDEVRVTATRPDPPDFWADPDIITRGDASTLRWTAHSSWTLSIDQGIGSLGAGSGSRPVRPTTTTTYTLTATLAGETVTVEAEVTVVPRPEVSITASRTQITLGDDVTLTWRARNTTRGTLLGAPFEGETSGDTTVTPGLGQTTYEITGRNAAGTTVTDEVRVDVVDDEPMASFDVYCNGLTCRFQSTSKDDITAFGDLDHDWTFGDGNTGTGPSPTHTYSSRGSYMVTLTVTDESGQTDSASESVSVSAPPVARFTAGCNQLDCVFDARDSSDDVGISEYFWTFGTETASGELVSHEFDASGTYSVTLRVTDTHGNVTYASGSVTTGEGDQRSGNTPPSPDFTVNCDGLGCTFTSTSTDDSGIVSWTWLTGDDAAAGTRAEHVHRYASPGIYTVNLAVRDERGALGVMAYWVTVTEQ